MIRRTLALLAVGGCEIQLDDLLPEDLPGVVMEGELVEIARDDSLPICAGDLAALDAHAAAVSEALGVHISPHDPIRYYWLPLEDVQWICGVENGGCAGARVAVGVGIGTGLHEIAHAVASPFGHPSTLWSEGLATAFQPGLLTKSAAHPAAMTGLDANHESFSYEQAGHFFRWAWGELSPPVMLDIYLQSSRRHDGSETRAAFLGTVGETLEAFGDRYLAEAPDRIASLVPRQVDMLAWTDDRWRHVIELDCDAENTRFVEDFFVRRVHLEIAETAVFEASTDADFVSIRRFDPVEWEPSTALDVRDWGATTGELAAGLYEVRVYVLDEPPVEVFVELHPAAHAPVVPE